MITETIHAHCAACKKIYKYKNVLSRERISTLGDNEYFYTPKIFEMRVHECPYCGYTAYDIEKETEISRDWKNIRKKLGLPKRSLSKANLFYKQYKIEMYRDNYTLAFCNIYFASRYDFFLYSKNLIHIFEGVIEEYSDYREELELLEIDYLRRNRLFFEAEKKIDEFKSEYRKYVDYSIYEKHLISKKDSKRKKYNDFVVYKRGLDNTFPKANNIKEYLNNVLNKIYVFDDYEEDDFCDEIKYTYHKFSNNVVILLLVIIVMKLFLRKYEEEKFLDFEDIIERIYINSQDNSDEETFNLFLNVSYMEEIESCLERKIPFKNCACLYLDEGNISEVTGPEIESVKTLMNGDKRIRLWIDNNVTGICFLHWLCYVNIEKEILIPEFKTNEEEYYHSGDISRYFFSSFSPVDHINFRELTLEEIKNFKEKWSMLSYNNADYRGLIEGKIVEYSYDQIYKDCTVLFNKDPSSYHFLNIQTDIEKKYGLSKHATKILIKRMEKDGYISIPVIENHTSITDKLRELYKDNNM